MKYPLLLGGLLLLSGCASDKTFVPNAASLTNTAHIVTGSPTRTGSGGTKFIGITKVDGKETTNRILTVAPTDIYLMPGNHVIGIEYRHKGMVAEKKLTIAVKAGRQYFVHDKVFGYGVDLWITEGQAGPTVAGKNAESH